MQKENKMGVMPVSKLVLTMSVPIMISMLVQSMYNIVDSIFVARISEAALTASVTMMIGYAVSGLGNGMVNLISTALRQCVVLIPLVYFFGRLGGINVIWFSFWIAEAFAAIYAAVQLRRRMKAVRRELAG